MDSTASWSRASASRMSEVKAGAWKENLGMRMARPQASNYYSIDRLAKVYCGQFGQQFSLTALPQFSPFHDFPRYNRGECNEECNQSKPETGACRFRVVYSRWNFSITLEQKRLEAGTWNGGSRFCRSTFATNSPSIKLLEDWVMWGRKKGAYNKERRERAMSLSQAQARWPDRSNNGQRWLNNNNDDK